MLISSSGDRYLLGLRKTIGRDPDNDIVLNRQTISKRHASIEFDDSKNAYYLLDKGSKNGTLVAGNKISNHHIDLVDNNEIKFGLDDVVYRFLEKTTDDHFPVSDDAVSVKSQPRPIQEEIQQKYTGSISNQDQNTIIDDLGLLGLHSPPLEQIVALNFYQEFLGSQIRIVNDMICGSKTIDQGKLELSNYVKLSLSCVNWQSHESNQTTHSIICTAFNPLVQIINKQVPTKPPEKVIVEDHHDVQAMAKSTGVKLIFNAITHRRSRITQRCFHAWKLNAMRIQLVVAQNMQDDKISSHKKSCTVGARLIKQMLRLWINIRRRRCFNDWKTCARRIRQTLLANRILIKLLAHKRAHALLTSFVTWKTAVCSLTCKDHEIELGDQMIGMKREKEISTGQKHLLRNKLLSAETKLAKLKSQASRSCTESSAIGQTCIQELMVALCHAEQRMTDIFQQTTLDNGLDHQTDRHQSTIELHQLLYLQEREIQRQKIIGEEYKCRREQLRQSLANLIEISKSHNDVTHNALIGVEMDSSDPSPSSKKLTKRQATIILMEEIDRLKTELKQAEDVSQLAKAEGGPERTAVYRDLSQALLSEASWLRKYCRELEHVVERNNLDLAVSRDDVILSRNVVALRKVSVIDASKRAGLTHK